MKLDAVKGNRDIQSSSDDQIEYGIDSSQMWLLYEILSQYSNPIGSIVRELTTNAFDSHIESSQDKRVTVRITERNVLTKQESRFEVEDYGTGLSPDRIEKIYSKFLASTKRDSNKEHGAFGLGSKSPFSYTDMFYMTTRYEGVEYFYAMHKGTNAPRIDLLSKEPTDEPNGTRVSINIDDGDRYKFRKEAKRQLAYFDNVNHEGTGVDNDYRIIEGDHFIFREHAQDLGLDRLHICLGKVYYPIDFNSVDLERINSTYTYGSSHIHTPIGLKFEIGDLPIIWSRENIEYSNEAISIIEDKYEKAQAELTKVFKDRTDSVTSIREYFNIKARSKSNELEIIDGVTIPSIHHMVEQEVNLEPYSELKNLPRPENALNLVYKVHKKVSKGIAHSVTSNYQKEISSLVSNQVSSDIPFRTKCYMINTAYNTRTNKYLYEELGTSIFYLISKKPKSEKSSESEILSRFGYEENSFDAVDSDIVDLIKKYTLECVGLLKDALDDYEDIDVPEDFSSTPANTTRTDIYDPSSEEYKPDKKVHFKSVKIDDSSYYRSNLIQGFTVYEPTIRHLLNYRKQLRIYGFQDDSDELERIANFLYHALTDTHIFSGYQQMPNPKRMMILKIAQNKEDILMDLSDNAIHVSDFVSKRHKVLVRELTYYYIENVLEEKNDLPLSKIDKDSLELTKDLGMTDYYETLKKGSKIMDKINFKSLHDERNRKVPSTLRYILESPAYLDQNILDDYHNALCYVKKYPLIYSLITKEMTPESRELLTDELKYYLKGKDQVNPVLKERLLNKQRREDLSELDRILETLNI